MDSELRPEVTPAVIASATRSAAATRTVIGVIRSAAGHSGPPHACSLLRHLSLPLLATHLPRIEPDPPNLPSRSRAREHAMRTELSRAVNGVAIDESSTATPQVRQGGWSGASRLARPLEILARERPPGRATGRRRSLRARPSSSS